MLRNSARAAAANFSELTSGLDSAGAVLFQLIAGQIVPNTLTSLESSNGLGTN